MSETVEEEIKRWIASGIRRRLSLRSSNARRRWRQPLASSNRARPRVEDDKCGVENALRPKPEDARLQSSGAEGSSESAWRGDGGDPRHKKAGIPAGQGRGQMRSAQSVTDEGTTHVKSKLAEPIKEIIEAEPSFGYRTVAAYRV